MLVFEQLPAKLTLALFIVTIHNPRLSWFPRARYKAAGGSKIG